MRCGPLPRFLLLLSDTYFPSDEWRVSSTYSLLVKLCFAFYNDSTSCRYYNTLCFCLDFLFLHLPKKYNCSLSHFSSFCLLSSTFGQRFSFFFLFFSAFSQYFFATLFNIQYVCYIFAFPTHAHTHVNAMHNFSLLFCIVRARVVMLLSRRYSSILWCSTYVKLKGHTFVFFLNLFACPPSSCYFFVIHFYKCRVVAVGVGTGCCLYLLAIVALIGYLSSLI